MSGAFLSSCLSAPHFDEAAWQEETRSTNPSLLYAKHYEDGHYFNPWLPIEHGGFTRLLRWRLSSREDYTDAEESYLPKLIPELPSRVGSAVAEGHDFIAWVGHGTFLVGLKGSYWIIDPILTDRALVPKRKTPPALSLQELNALGLKLNLIVTHNHYDHLDAPTVRGLAHTERVFVPLGLKGTLENLGMRRVTEMDWWQTLELPENMRLVCLPAQHWSIRIGQWRNRTLWASFLLMAPGRTVYIGGDSGYFIGYKEIGTKYPGIDYALLPLTAYHPRWFMHYAHMNAQEVLEAFEDLGAHFLVPTQWGTFRLGNEPAGYPALDLRRTMEKKSVNPSRVLIMDLGQMEIMR
ncbi:MAG: hypothetical protein GX443_14590 [Deltaproteobacteria bacterium]|nr:hypothetical protein [Deltaproteobacteria bacterium]